MWMCAQCAEERMRDLMVATTILLYYIHTWLSWSTVMRVFHGSRKKRRYVSSVRALLGISFAGRRLPFRSVLLRSNPILLPLLCLLAVSLRSTELQIFFFVQRKANAEKNAAWEGKRGPVD